MIFFLKDQILTKLLFDFILLYDVLDSFAILPMMLCSGFSLLFGCILMLVVSGLYLMRSLGQKASQQEMKETAVNLFPPPSSVIFDPRGQFVRETKIPVESSNLTGDLPPLNPPVYQN